MVLYFIALIQNESEMMRYSWADVRPAIDNMGYSFDSYTAENLALFFVELARKKYDAVIIAANACNDSNVLEGLKANKEIIEGYLKSGGGLLISFQMRLASYDSYGFLPEEYEIKAINRIVHGESPKDGCISKCMENEDNVLHYYPKVVDEEKVNENCLHNDNVEGIYWTYLIPKHPENYDVIIEDKYNRDRQLLVVSKETLGARIVVTSLSLDWQMHTELLGNAIEYVVRGRPTIAILKKRGIDNFEFKYLVSTYESSKLSFKEYCLDKLTSEEIVTSVHDVLIIDTAWNEDEVSTFINDNKIDISVGKYKVITFGANKSPSYSVISSYKTSQGIIDAVLVWLQSIYNSDRPYWQGSFWRTYDVLYAFNYFKIPICVFENSITSELDKHDKNGSYDEVLGATCAMFQIYNWFYDDKEYSKLVRTKKWIEDNLYTKALFEKATAFDILISNGMEITELEKDNLKKEIEKQLLNHNNEFTLYRYCKTLYVCGYLQEAINIVEKLFELQDSKEGKWVNLSHTAAVLDLLLDLYCDSNQNSIVTIEKMILKGISYIKSHYNYDEKSWNQDASVSAKCIVVLEKFERLVTLPIDLVLLDSNNSLKMISVNKILKAAMKNNVNYLQDINAVKKQEEINKKEVYNVNKKNEKLTLINLILGGFFCAELCVFFILLNYVSEKHKIEKLLEFCKGFLSHNLKSISSILICLIIFVYIYWLLKYKNLPKWIKFILKQKIDLSGQGENGE